MVTKAIIVKRGTESGKPTVDFQFEAGTSGKEKFVAMLTGELVKGLAEAIRGAESVG
jgi:hypothetical protein